MGKKTDDFSKKNKQKNKIDETNLLLILKFVNISLLLFLKLKLD